MITVYLNNAWSATPSPSPRPSSASRTPCRRCKAWEGGGGGGPGGAGRGALLASIQGGKGLKKVQTNDRSAPVTGSKFFACSSVDNVVNLTFLEKEAKTGQISGKSHILAKSEIFRYKK